MRAPTLILVLCAAGCGAAPGSIAPAPPVAEAAVELRVRATPPLALFECTHRVTFLEGDATPVSARSQLQLRRFRPDGTRWLRYRRYEAVEGAGARLPSMQMRTLIDLRHHVLEGPEPTESSPRSQAVVLALAFERLLAPYYPLESVRPGDSWSEPAFHWGIPPIDPAAVEVERRFALERVRDGVAHIRWDTAVRLQELSVGGVSLSGEVSITGERQVALEDGLSGEALFDVEVDVRPSGAPGMLARLQIGAKVRSAACPRPATPTAASYKA